MEITRTFCEEPPLQVFHSLFLSCNEPVCDVRSTEYLKNKKLENEEKNDENYFFKKLHLKEKLAKTDLENRNFTNNDNDNDKETENKKNSTVEKK